MVAFAWNSNMWNNLTLFLLEIPKGEQMLIERGRSWNGKK